jgi:hypothetical protein
MLPRKDRQARRPNQHHQSICLGDAMLRRTLFGRCLYFHSTGIGQTDHDAPSRTSALVMPLTTL